MGEDAVGGILWGDGGVPTRDTGTVYTHVHLCTCIHVDVQYLH